MRTVADMCRAVAFWWRRVFRYQTLLCRTLYPGGYLDVPYCSNSEQVVLTILTHITGHKGTR